MILQYTHRNCSRAAIEQRQHDLTEEYVARLRRFVQTTPTPKAAQEAIWIDSPKETKTTQESAHESHARDVSFVLTRTISWVYEGR